MSIVAESQTIQNRIKNPTDSYKEFRYQEVEQTIPACFENKVAKFTNRIAIKGQTDHLTYTDLNRAANRITHAIIDHYRAGDDPIIVLLDCTATLIVAILGILKAGKIFVILDPKAPIDHLVAMCVDSQAGLIITSDNYASL